VRHRTTRSAVPLRRAFLRGDAPEGSLSQATILVVEDDQFVLKLVKQILTNGECAAENCSHKPDYEVLTARSAAEGLRIGLEFPRPIHLLLADVVMEGMLGTEVAERIKEQRPAMRVILMSGYLEGELKVLQGGWKFLRKPFVAEALLDRVRAALETQAAGGR
jgi:CheY-like chemotaxis protein